MSEIEKSISRREFGRRLTLATLGTWLATKYKGDTPDSESNIWRDTEYDLDPNLVRILIFSDIHLGESFYPRQAHPKAKQTLKKVVSQLKGTHFDWLVNNGDNIQETYDEDTNVRNLMTCIGTLQWLDLPAWHLLGNHDWRRISQARMRRAYRQLGLDDTFRYQHSFNDFQIVGLDLDTENDEYNTLPTSTLDWLLTIITPETPTILFSHYGFLPQKTKGNFHFHRTPAKSALTNGQEAWQALKHLPIKAVISGHTHWGSHTKVDNTHMVTVPAFTENIVGYNQRDNPGVYSVLEVGTDLMTIKSFFGSYCFLNLDLT